MQRDAPSLDFWDLLSSRLSSLVAVDALGEPVAPRWYTDRSRAPSRDAGLPVARIRDTRYACGSHLLDQGVPLPIVSAFLGHASPYHRFGVRPTR